MKRVGFLSLAVFAWAGAAHASLLYQFTVMEVPGAPPTQGFIDPFSFSLTVPTFLESGDSPPFTAFTVTDSDMRVWTITDDLIGTTNAGNGCFMFGGGTATLRPGCIVGAEAGAMNAAFFLDLLASPLPTAVGVYSSGGGGIFQVMTPGDGDGVLFNATLSIASVTPAREPASLSLFAFGIAAIGARILQRRLASIS